MILTKTKKTALRVVKAHKCETSGAFLLPDTARLSLYIEISYYTYYGMDTKIAATLR